MRRPFVFLSVVALIGACLPAFGFDAKVPPAQRNVLLFSWDGVQREHLMECLTRNELPNLAALIKEGHLVNIDVTSHQTETKPGHVQMLTGYDPSITGTPTNGKFRVIPKGLSIFERLERAFGDDKITTLMITGALHHVGACPPATPADMEQARAELARLQASPETSDKDLLEKWNSTLLRPRGEPFWNVRNSIDHWEGESRRYNKVMGPIMLDALDKYGKDRFFAFFHYIDTDHEGHGFGENSKEYNDAIIMSDRWLGAFVKKLKELGVYDKTMVFVTSDHGFDEGARRHTDAPRVFLAGNMKSLVKSGDQRDIVPTILAEMGVDPSTAHPRYKGSALTR